MSDMQTRIHVDGDRMVVQNTQDCTAIAERAKAMHNDGVHGSKDMRLAATIPEIMVEQYCQQGGITFREFMVNPTHIRRMLQDPALAHFRIWKGRI